MQKPRVGDWVCAGCRELNFAYRTSCRKCSRDKNGGGGVAVSHQGRPGDWNCHCGELNFKGRTSCRKCGGAQVAGTTEKRPGDWSCTCGELNFGTRVVCRRCSKGRDDNHSQQQQQQQQQVVCAVCMERPADTAITVCGHVSLCASRLDACPMCRTKYSPNQTLKVFVSGVS